MTCDQTSRLVTAAEDRGDGDEPKANEPKGVVREWLDMAKLQPINACHVLRHPPISPGELDAIESILALVSRLEETIRADGEAFQQIVAADIRHEGDDIDQPGHRSSRTFIGPIGMIARNRQRETGRGPFAARLSARHTARP